MENAILDVSGRDGGGQLRLGGEYLGGQSLEPLPGLMVPNLGTPNAQNTLVGSNVFLLGNAVQRGNGGQLITWADGETHFYGNIQARGGLEGGNGGFAEVSGKGYLNFQGWADLTPQHAEGQKGTLLLDPTDIEISNFAPNDASVAANLKLWLDASDASTVTLTYDTDGLSTATASGTAGTNTITTSADVSASLAVGARIRLGAAGTVTTANTLGADTYTIASISGTTITTVETLTSTYTGQTLHRGLVSQWSDKSGNANNATQGTASGMPLWIAGTGGQNGNGVLNFDGNNDNLSLLVNPQLISQFSIFTASALESNPGNGNPNIIDTWNWQVNKRSWALGTLENQYAFFVSRDGTWDNRLQTTSSMEMVALTDVLLTGTYNGIAASLYKNNYLTSTASYGTPTTIFYDSNTTTYIGRSYGGGDRFLKMELEELFIYDVALSTSLQNLSEQYQSAKWGIALTPSGTGATEAAKAMASDGYSVFHKGYLERLSQSADIALVASNSITIKDLTANGGNGALTLAAGRSLSLTAGAGGVTMLNTANTLRTNGGSITVNSGGAVTLGHLDTTGNGATATGGNISLTGTSIATGSLRAGTAGDITITPNGTVALGSFTSSRDVTVNGTATVNTAQTWSAGRHFTLGGTYTLPTSWTLQALGGDLTVNAGTTVTKSTGGDATLNLLASNSILFNGSSGSPISITSSSNKLNLILNADSDASGAGAISLAFTTLTSNGGDITLGGGANPLIGFAQGGLTGNLNGIALTDSHIHSAIGEINLRGIGSADGADKQGIRMIASTINSSNGNISLVGIGSNNNTWNNHGVILLTTSSIQSTAGNINITGTGGTNSFGSRGIFLLTSSGTTAVSSTSGNINLVGTAGQGSVCCYSSGIELYSNDVIQSIDGNITLNVTGPTVSNGTNHGLLNLGNIRTTGLGNIEISSLSNTGSFVVTLAGLVETNQGSITINSDALSISSPITSNSGGITLKPYAATTAINIGNGAVNSGLQINQTELNYLSTNGFLRIGNQSNAQGITTLNSWDWTNKNFSDVSIFGQTINITGVNTIGSNIGRFIVEAKNGDLNFQPGSSFVSNGSQLVLAAAGNFHNNSGSATPISLTGGGRYLIYSSNPGNDTLGGMTRPNKRYNFQYGDDTSGLNGSWHLYSVAPTLTVTADNASRTYGASNPTFTGSVTGLIDGDTLGQALTGSVNYSTAATQSSNAGTYAITASAASALGYQFQYVDGTLTVNKANLTVTVGDASRPFRGQDPALSASYSGFVLGQGPGSLGGGLRLTPSANPNSLPGSYSINASGLTSQNYNILYQPGTLTVTKYGFGVDTGPTLKQLIFNMTYRPIDPVKELQPPTRPTIIFPANWLEELQKGIPKLEAVPRPDGKIELREVPKDAKH